MSWPQRRSLSGSAATRRSSSSTAGPVSPVAMSARARSSSASARRASSAAASTPRSGSSRTFASAGPVHRSSASVSARTAARGSSRPSAACASSTRMSNSAASIVGLSALSTYALPTVSIAIAPPVPAPLALPARAPVPVRVPASVLRSFATWPCSAVRAVGGGPAGHNRSIRSSAAHARPGRSANHARSRAPWPRRPTSVRPVVPRRTGPSRRIATVRGTRHGVPDAQASSAGRTTTRCPARRRPARTSLA